MIYFILAIILLTIGKFIYDSFLTNNTEKNWEKFKKDYPHKATTIENSKGFNMNPNAKIRTDGYYVNKYNGLDYKGEPITFYNLLFFSKNGFVVYLEVDNIIEWRRENTDDSVKTFLFELDKIKKIENPSQITNYQVSKGSISMKFYDDDDYFNDAEIKCYERWRGSIIHNGLILSLVKFGFNSALKDYVEETMLRNLKFEFNQIRFN